MSISDGSDRTSSCRKMEETWSVREEMDARVFISRQSWHPFSLINTMIKVLFPSCTFIWRVNICFPPRKDINRRNESIIRFIKYSDCCVLLFSAKTPFDCLYCWNFIPHIRGDSLILTRKDKFSLHH